MNITIKTAVQDEKGILLAFDSCYGEGTGYWRGGAQPSLGGIFYVEFDVDLPLSLSNCRQYSDGALGFCIDNELLLIRAAVDAVDEDGMAFIRVANDCLLMIDTEELFFPAIGSHWEIAVPQEQIGIYLVESIFQ